MLNQEGQDQSDQDIMSAQEIRDELQKLTDSERAEFQEDSASHVGLLESAMSNLDKFIEAEKDDQALTPAKAIMSPDLKSPIVDTSVLTGPINGLKNFLIRKSQDNQAQ